MNIGKFIAKKIFKKNPIVVVSGLPRSGTSLMMQMLHSGGLEPLTDEIRKADNDNPKGYYEFERVKNLPDGDTLWIDDAKGKVVKIISTLLIYLPKKYDYKIIFMRREIPEIIASQAKMIINRGTQDADDDEELTKKMFVEHVAGVEKWIDSNANVDCLMVPFSDLFVKPMEHIDQIIKFTGVDLNKKAMQRQIDPKLYRNREK